MSIKCDGCGKFVSYMDLSSGSASRVLVTPDSHFSREEYETKCAKCIHKDKFHLRELVKPYKE